MFRKGEIAVLVEDAKESMKDHEPLRKNTHVEFDRQLSFGDRLADKFADFAGSGRFIALFTAEFFLDCDEIHPSYGEPFNPYPFMAFKVKTICTS